MCCRWSYIWFFMSKMIRWLIQAEIYPESTLTTWDTANVPRAMSSSWMSSVMFRPIRASSTIRPVMMEGSSPTTEERRMVTNTRANWIQ